MTGDRFVKVTDDQVMLLIKEKTCATNSSAFQQ